LLKQKTEWQWHQLGHMQVCTSLHTTPAPHRSRFFTGRMPFLSPNQQRRSTEGKNNRKSLQHISSKDSETFSCCVVDERGFVQITRSNIEKW